MKNLWLQERMHSKLLTKFKKIRLNIFYKAGAWEWIQNSETRNSEITKHRTQNSETTKW